MCGRELGSFTVTYEYVYQSHAGRVMRFTDFEGLHEREDEDERIKQC
jgi:hypothetical protein